MRLCWLLVLTACAHAPEVGAPQRLPVDLTEAELALALPEIFTDGTRIHLATDRPLYRPGEAIWVQSFARSGATLRSVEDGLGRPGMHFELVDPRGEVVASSLAEDPSGIAHGVFDLPAGAAGGLWAVRAVAVDGTVRERRVAVVPFEAPKVLGDAEFLREGYAAGDEIVALVDLRRPTGEPLADTEVEATLLVDGDRVATATLRTDAEGRVRVALGLPESLPARDALLSVTDGQGGSVIRPVPVASGTPELGLFPEGGQLVAGLSSRIYLEALDPVGEPVDVSGEVVDDRGTRVTTFEARRGRARFSLVPEAGRTYTVRVTHPEPVEATLPAAETDGCVLQAGPARVGVRCTGDREVVVVGSLRGRLLDAARVRVRAGEVTEVDLASDNPALDRLQGVVQVTLTDEDLVPLAERVVYRNRGRDLQVKLVPEVDEAIPGQQVRVEIQTRDPEGRPVPADVLVRAVDDAFVNAADDDERDIRSALLLEPTVGDVDDPASYLDVEDPDSAEDLDRLLGTRGWRRIERVPVAAVVDPEALPPPPPPADGTVVAKDFLQRIPAGRSYQTAIRAGAGGNPNVGGGAYNENTYMLDGANITDPVTGAWSLNRHVALAVELGPDVAELDRRRLASKRKDFDACFAREQARTPDIGGSYLVTAHVDRKGHPSTPAVRGHHGTHGGVAACIAAVLEDVRFLPGQERTVSASVGERPPPAQPNRPFVVARTFPTPPPRPPGALRQDRRATIAWAPALRTGKDGRATVSLVTSDSVTGFRIVAEALVGGTAGVKEVVLPSRPPLSATVRTPDRLVVGDAVELSVVLDNATSEPLEVHLGAEVEGAVEVGDPDPGSVIVRAGEQVVAWLPLTAATPGAATLRLTAATPDGAHVDAVERTLEVGSRGFPRVLGATHRMDDDVVRVALDTRDALPGTLRAAVQLAPGPSAATEGLESLAREPHGCFEQTSATSYPNVLILSALHRTGADPADVRRVRGLVKRGVDRLMTFETPDGGFEWFGRAPGHVALTAYGLLQFSRTAEVVPEAVDRRLIDRVAQWLLDQRDGDGGFVPSTRGLDRFGSAPLALTDAYATWALADAGLAAQLGAELDRQARVAETTDDPYALALAALALQASTSHARAGRLAAEALLARQAEDGSFPGAATSITHSGGADLLVESTALAARALSGAGLDGAAARARAWLAGARRPQGTWGSTQATVLALEALLQVPEEAREGSVLVTLNGASLGSLAPPTGLAAATRVLDLSPGRHELTLLGPKGLPATVRASYWSLEPPASPLAPLSLAVDLADGPFAVGDPVRLTATVRNVSDADQHSPVARIGVPAGLSVQPWQLDDLVDRGVVSALEVVDGSVVAYWDGLAPGQEAKVALDLLAEVAGRTAGDASAAWPYYTSDARTWARAVEVEVARER